MKLSILQYTRARLTDHSKVWRVGGSVFVLAMVTALGVYVVTRSYAVAPGPSLQAEDGTVSSAAATVNDTSASAGRAVKFGNGIADNFCSSYPALPSTKPDATNTGVPAGTTLTNASSITVSTVGAVVNAMNVSGGIVVSANNVTIENSKITTTGYYGIQIGSGVTGTKIIHNEIYTANGGYTGIAGSGADETICANYIYGWENGMTLTGGNMMVQANFIEKLQSNQSGPHYDGIELYAGSTNTFYGNNILMTDSSGNWLSETGAINVTGQYSAVNNTAINGNWLGGGSYTLNTDDGQGYAVTNVTVTNNVFYGSAPAGYAAYGPIREPSVVTTWSGNTWSATGQTVSS